MTTLTDWKAYHGLQWGIGHKTKVSIVGFCNTSRDYTPYKDPDMEVWGLNRGTIFMPSADRWFEMHGRNIYTMQQRRPGRHVDWLNAFRGPVYMHQVFEDVKNSVSLPLQELAADLGIHLWRVDKAGTQTDTTNEPYLSSSIAYELALAIWEGFKEIHLYGVDLNTESEYAWQKPGVEYLLGVAVGRGIKVVLPDNCPLARGKLYGRGFLAKEPEAMSYEQLDVRMKSLRHEQEQVAQEATTLSGSLRELTYIADQMIPGLDQEILEERKKQMSNRLNQLQARDLEVRGHIKESAYWIHQTMSGQEPKEAIDQIRAILAQGPDEGPIGPLEVLQSVDSLWASVQQEKGSNASGALVPI